MNTYCRRTWLALLAATSILIARPALAASEDSLIKELDSPNADTVAKALLALEKQYPTSTKALPIMKKLLSDNREKVKRKAARVLGSLHADVSSNDIKAFSWSGPSGRSDRSTPRPMATFTAWATASWASRKGKPLRTR